MGNHSMLKRLFLLFVLVGALTLGTVAAFAQEAGAATTEAAAEEAAAEESHNEEAAPAEGEAAAEEAGGNPLTPLGINTGFLLAQIVNFLIIFLLLRSLLWNPLRNMLDSRGATIQKGLEDAAAAANARRNAEAEAEKILAQARVDAARVAEEARARGDEAAKGAERAAREEAERIRAEGRAAATDERNRQLAELRGQVAAIGVAVAERLIGESLDAKRQQALINDFFAKVPADARSLGGDVEVISAMPLEAKEQETIRKEVGAQNVTFTVDPSILGGLIVRSSDRVVDGSVRSGLTGLASSLR